MPSSLLMPAMLKGRRRNGSEFLLTATITNCPGTDAAASSGSASSMLYIPPVKQQLLISKARLNIIISQTFILIDLSYMNGERMSKGAS
jgi:hypothetical protein